MIDYEMTLFSAGAMNDGSCFPPLNPISPNMGTFAPSCFPCTNTISISPRFILSSTPQTKNKYTQKMGISKIYRKLTGEPHPPLPKRRTSSFSPGQPLESSTRESQLFQRLPAEIRRQILVAAFGRRTLHLDIRYSHPRCNGSWARWMLSRWAPKRWVWTGFVCPRYGGVGAYTDTPPDRAKHGMPPYLDGCRRLTNRILYGMWPWEIVQRNPIGALGWLRTCRAAYEEGIEVLYSTNVFHVFGVEHLDTPPQSTSAELSHRDPTPRADAAHRDRPRPDEGPNKAARAGLGLPVALLAAPYPSRTKKFDRHARGAARDVSQPAVSLSLHLRESRGAHATETSQGATGRGSGALRPCCGTHAGTRTPPRLSYIDPDDVVQQRKRMGAK